MTASPRSYVGRSHPAIYLAATSPRATAHGLFCFFTIEIIIRELSHVMKAMMDTHRCVARRLREDGFSVCTNLAEQGWPSRPRSPQQNPYNAIGCALSSRLIAF